MASARFKELCLDVGPGEEHLGDFWASVAGLRWDREGEIGDLLGTQEGMGIALCPVPEHKTVKHRVHLDVSVNSLDEVISRGARVLEQPAHWTVLADPAGGEFCAFVREGELPTYRIFEVVIDSVDPGSIAAWWADRFGIEAQSDGRPYVWLKDAPGFPEDLPWWVMVFAPVPEPKTVKNRIHWDVYGDPQDFIDAGATKLWEVPGRTRPIAWTTLADPEGNEFCVFPHSDRA